MGLPRMVLGGFVVRSLYLEIEREFDVNLG